jgi:PAS domain S-box-containing protein
MDDSLRRAALAVSAAEGGGVFNRLAGELAEILGVAIGFIAVFDDAARSRMRMLAFHLDGRLRTPFTYPLEGSPCASVVGKEFRCVSSGARREFPEDDLFARHGLESYAAFPLNDAAGAPLGVIGAMDRRPLRDPALCEAVLKIFALRGASELEHGALRASEHQYRAIFNAAADSMVLRDADFRIVDVNPAYEQMSGRRREEVLGRDLLTMSPLERNAEVRLLHQRALAGETVMFESRARRKNGERFHIETRGVPIEHQGRPHVLYVGRDITARFTAEKALRASEEQYRAVFNAVADALVLRDADFRIVDVNRAYVMISGYSRDEVIGLQRVVTNPHESEAWIRSLHTRALAGEPVMMETTRVCKDGTRIEVELRGVPIEFRGQPHVLYIGRDVSQRKRTEETLRASEEQYRAIFNATTDALVLRDAQARVVDVNPAFLAMSGFTREEVISQSRWFFAGPAMSGLAKDMHQRVIGGESVHFEVQGIRKDGAKLLVEMHAVPMMYRGAPHALGMARDITAQKRAEEQRAVLEAQLRQAQRMEAIGHLTGGIAHDFNNLLATIMGYVTLAGERAEAIGDGKLAHYLEQSLASSRRARDLIQQMLTFSRGQRSAPKAMNLAAGVEGSLTLMRGSLPATLEIRTDIDLAAGDVLLDPVQLDQVLLNLAINARDAVAGPGVLHIAVRGAPGVATVCASCRQRFEGDFVELTVADTGPGIAPRVLERMFEPFFTTKDVGRGSGMGLATVHGIVHEHRGHIVVESGEPRGSRFRILLPPLAADATLPLSAPRPAHHATADGKSRSLKGRVLVVDDEAPLAEFMRELLSGWGIEATAITSPRKALQAFRADLRAYDLVITDLAMPGSTGFGLARELLALRPGLPVILYTGHIDPIAERELESAGIRALLSKPVEPDKLHGLLARLLP